MISNYLKKYGYQPISLNQTVESGLNMIVVIPAFNEPNLIETLKSLNNCDMPENPMEIIVVFNHSEIVDEVKKEDNHRFSLQAKEFTKEKNLKHKVLFIEAFDLPKKIAGVGLARKIGMDEAASRLGKNTEGIIVALDADCTVAPNYLVSIEKHFARLPETPGASIYFKHPLDFSDKKLQKGIIEYELHLRYYNQLIKYTGHPFAFHTIGSSMAVRSWAYMKQGGMNKRKAGEDFYFLQKIMLLGKFTEINTTCVYPSARISDRVPFGTGKAQGDWVDKQKEQWMSYHPDAAEGLKKLFDLIVQKGKEISEMDIQFLPDEIIEFVGAEQWKSKMEELAKNTANDQAFIKRFFAWFNLFVVLKYVHYYRDNEKDNIPVSRSACDLLVRLGIDFELEDSLNILKKYRKLEKGIFEK